MTIFALLAHLSPLAVGFGVPAALALTWRRPLRRRLVAALGVLGGVLAVLAAAAVTESLRALIAVGLLLAGLGVLVAGLFAFAASFRLPPEICQIAAGLVVVALLGLIFCFGPVLRHAEEVGMSGDEIDRRITLALAVNPFMVLGYSVFNEDPLVSPRLYPLGLRDYRYRPPRWSRTAAGYALAGFVLFAASLGLTALRLRFAK